MRTALVIGKTNPFYGYIVQVGAMTPEGVYPITPVNEKWHTGYAREDQLEFHKTQAVHVDTHSSEEEA